MAPDHTPSQKALNNDWSAEATWSADGMEISLLSEGNEARGEIPQTNAQMNIPDYLNSDECDLEAGHAGTSPEHISTTKWATEGVTMTLTLSGEHEIIETHEEALVKRVEEKLPGGWERFQA